MTLCIENEEKLIEELKKTLISIPALNENTKKTDGWADNIARLNDLVKTEDPRAFLQWDVIKKTMEVGNADFIETELKFLRGLDNWARWEKAICEVSIGSPTRSNIYPKSSGNLIHHAYHVARFEYFTSKNVTNMDCIFEFGGGYGSMYRLVHNLGFRGKYIIFDLPIFSAIQKYFIKSIGLEVHTLNSFKKSKTGVICVTDIQVLQELILEYMPTNKGMFLATWSLSECPLELREKVLSVVLKFDNFLLGYQGRFEGLDNVKFFHEWKNGLKTINWHHEKIDHLPNKTFKDNYYLMGAVD